MGTLSLPPALLNLLIQTFTNLNASRYVAASGVVVMFYDWLLTLPAEVDTVWNARKGFTSCLFFVNRYLPFPCILLFNYQLSGMRPPVTDKFCKGEILTRVIAYGITLTISTWLLSLRVISLWSRKKLVVYSVYALYITMQVTVWTLTIISLYNMYPSVSYVDAVKVCQAASVGIIGGAYFAPISFEIYIFSLQVIHHYRHTRITRQHNAPTFTLLTTLYHDGYVHFIVVVSLRLLTCLVWATAPQSLWYMSSQLEYAMTSALTSRFYLNIRSVSSTSNQSTYFTSNVSFSSRPTSSRSKRLHAPAPTLLSSFGNVSRMDDKDIRHAASETERDYEMGRI